MFLNSQKTMQSFIPNKDIKISRIGVTRFSPDSGVYCSRGFAISILPDYLLQPHL